MIKKELLCMEHMRATSTMVKTAKEDKAKKIIKTYKGYAGSTWTDEIIQCKYHLYFAAAVESEILKIAVFTRKWILKNNREPQFEIFIDQKNNDFITYEPLLKKWRTAKINMLNCDTQGKSYLYASEEYQATETRKLVNEYFETKKNLNVMQAILDFQSNVRNESLKQKYKSELEQIDATMKEVPELPKGFDDWIIKNCFKETLFYERERPHRWPDVFCTHCGERMQAPAYGGQPEHGKEILCPKCHTEAIYRSWNKQKYVSEEIDVGILQKLKDGSGYIIRSFSCKLKRNHENGWHVAEFHKYENVRSRLTVEFAEKELFEYGEYKYTGVTRWCHQCRRSAFGYYNYSFGNTYMYTPNLKREFKNERFSKLDLKSFFKGGQKKRVDAVFILQRLYQYPFIEYLQKSGLTNLVDEIMQAREKKELFNLKSMRIHEVLMLDKQRFHRLKKVNGNCRVLKAMQYEAATGERLTEEHLKFIMLEDIDIMRLEMERTFMTLPRTLNYLKGQQEKNDKKFQQIVSFYRDYLDMAENRGMELSDEIVCRNNRMMEFHDRYLEEKNREDNIGRDKKVNLDYPEIRVNYSQNTKHFFWEKKGYVITVPRMASDITKEGRRQHHCVGSSNRFISNMNQNKSFILFLRKTNDKNMPYYTLEVNWDGKIIQYYAAYDRQPDGEKIKELLDEWTLEIKKRVQKENAKEKTDKKILNIGKPKEKEALCV